MFSRLLLAATVLTITELPAQYSQADINAAIDLGLRGRVGRIESTCIAEIQKAWKVLAERLSGHPRRYRITGHSPLALVALYAAGTQRRYEPVPRASDKPIIDLLSADVFTVWIRPHADRDMGTAARLADTKVERVVLRPSRGKRERYVVQPLAIHRAGSELVENLAGASVQLESIVATFASADVITLAKGSHAEVVVVTPDGEFTCRFGKKKLLRGYFPASW